jgi:hypothetical protein
VTWKFLEKRSRWPGHNASIFQDALKLVDKPHFDVVKAIGLSCAFPFALQNAVHIISQTTDYER